MDKQIESIINRDYELRKGLYEHIDIKKYDGERSLYAKYILAYLSEADVLITQTELNDFVENTYAVKNAYHQNIPDQVFFDYVLQPKVNNEKLDACRQYFRSITEAIIVDDLKETIFALNYWMIGIVQYRSTDARTQYASLTYKNGTGRCGEKSTFLVQVLRANGIPARQIYAPWWTHSDDRHAWVEVYIDGEWHYLGAGDAEETFDTAWFTLAASRALVVQSNQFSNLPTSEPVLEDHGIYKKINVIQRYNRAHEVVVEIDVETIKVVSVCVVNYGNLKKVVTQPVLNGKALFTLGGGDAFVYAQVGEKHYIESINESTQSVILNNHSLIKDENIDLVQKAQDLHLKPKSSTEIEAHRKVKRKNEGLKRYRERIATLEENRTKEEPQNIQELRTRIGNLRTEEVLSLLSEKDRYDFDANMLVEHCDIVEKHRGKFPIRIFRESILNPRVAYENMVAYAKEFETYCEDNPIEIYNSVMNGVSEESEYFVEDTIIPFTKVISNNVGTYFDKQLTIVAICRSKGIPARFNDVNNVVEIYVDGNYLNIERKPEFNVKLTEDMAKYTVSLTPSNPFQDTGDFIIQNTAKKVEGRYLAIASNRLPNGTIIGTTVMKSIVGDCSLDINVKHVSIEDLLENIEISDLMKSLDINLLKGFIVIGNPDEEPTQHVINELIIKKETIQKSGSEIVFFNGGEMNHPMLQLLSNAFDNVLFVDTWRKDIEEMMVRRHFREPKVYPFVVIVKNGKTLLSSCGYQVGFVDNENLGEILK
ncbi:MAG: transglutaminase-like domain-containing protein [Erysipelothrix sp.]